MNRAQSVGSEIRVLVADSTPMSCQLLADALTRDPHFRLAVVCTGSKDILEGAATYALDVAVVSAYLDEEPLKGFEVARQLRRRATADKLLLVAMTGYGREEDRRRCREAGFDLHLTKPVDPLEIEQLLTKFAAETV